MIAVTGSTGFIGSHLLVELSKKNFEFIAFKRINSDTTYTQKIFKIHGCSNLFSTIKWVDCNLNNYLEVYEKLKGISIIVHAASIVNLSSNSSSLIKNNVEITKNIVNACIEHNVKLLHISSIATIEIKNKIGREEYKINPNDPHNIYTLSKYFSELEVWKGIEEGLLAVILHPAVVIGYLRNEKLLHWLYRYMKRKTIYVPDFTVSIVDVKDVVSAIITIIEKKLFNNENYIITSYNISLKDLVKIFIEKANFRNSIIKPINVTRFKYLFKIGDLISRFFDFNFINSNILKLMQKDYIYDNKKFIQATQFKYTPLEQTIEDLIKTYEEICKK